MRTTAAVFSLLSLFGCRPRASAPEKPGVSIALEYPVLLIGQGSLDVRDSEEALTSIRGASSLNLNERVVLDSQGRLFKVKLARPIRGQESPLWSMGTKDVRYWVDVEKPSRPGWPEIQRLAMEQVHSPQVLALKSVSELIAGARESWRWRH
jgi:hypothetical protein